MSSLLFRLGRWTAGHARRVVAAWVLLVLAAGAAAGLAGGQLQNDLTIPGTESQAGLDVLEHRFPQVAGTNGQLLFEAPPGHRIGQYAGQVRDVIGTVRDAPHVLLVTDPFDRHGASRIALSRDGRYALAQLQLDVGLDRLDQRTVAALDRAAHTLPAGSPVQVHLGGSVFTTTAVHVSTTEASGILVALAVLAVTFGSLLAAGLPIVTAVVGVAVAMSGILGVAALTDVSASTPTLALMIGLAVGIDYALFIVSRHRAQLASGMAAPESVARSVATAGSAVVFAGTTVVIALAALVVARIPFLAVMGYAAAAAVALAVLVALTLVPALLSLAGERLRPRPASRAARHALADPDDRHTLGARWVALVTRAPTVTVVLGVALLLVMTLPAKDLALGLPDNGTKERGTEPRTTYDLVSRVYGPGFNAPLLVTADIIRTTDPVGVMHRMGRDLSRLDGVRAVALATPNPKADLGIVQVVPEHGQTDPTTAALVRELRDERATLEHRYGVTDLKVTGHTAVTIDVSDRLSSALLPFAAVVAGLSLLLLTVVFRSLAVPLKATLGYLLSVGASFGAVAAVFEWGWFADVLHVARTGPVISFMPILLMGVLFGLAMDYEVFLVSRIREEYVRTGDARRAVAAGFTASARVVTAAAVIMISVFAAFVPHSDATVKPVALGLAVGVFVDAFVVRMTLVPAVLALLGDRAWWLPRRLDRRLPSLDVEGAALAEHDEHGEWVRRNGAVAVRAEGLTLLDGTGAPVLEDVHASAPPGTLLVARSEDRVARRAFLACVAGRLAPTAGALVVLDRVLPAEAGWVRAHVPFHPEFPDTETLLRHAGRTFRGTALVVVDDVDLLVPSAVQADRWRLLHDLTAYGVTVVAGCAAYPLVVDAPGLRCVDLDVPQLSTAALPEEALR